jgi:hypothetical protein
MILTHVGREVLNHARLGIEIGRDGMKIDL